MRARGVLLGALLGLPVATSTAPMAVQEKARALSGTRQAQSVRPRSAPVPSSPSQIQSIFWTILLFGLSAFVRCSIPHAAWDIVRWRSFLALTRAMYGWNTRNLPLVTQKRTPQKKMETEEAKEAGREAREEILSIVNPHYRCRFCSCCSTTIILPLLCTTELLSLYS
jgi:hypothetical protein